MRILIVYPKIFIYGGAELLVVKLCNYLSKMGIQNTLLTTSIIPEVADALNETHVLIAEKPEKKNLYLHLWRSVRENIRHYDLLNVHNFPAELAAFLCDIPVVWMCNEPELHLIKSKYTSTKQKITWNILAKAERHIVKKHIANVVVSDSFNAQRFSSLYGGIQPEIIHYGIDFQFFGAGDKRQARAKLGLGEKFAILHSGMITPLKNQLQSLKALRGIITHIPNPLLVFAGFWDDAYRAELDTFISKYDLHRFVLFTGLIDRNALRDYYHACDVLLQPIYSQGGWLSPFEALCAETPIIVSKEMTAAYLIEIEQLGVVTDRYSDAIIDVFENREKYQSVAARTASWVEQNLSWDRFCEGMVQIFRNSLKVNN